MGTLSNKYPNAQAVENALNKGVDAYDNMGQIELVYNGTDIRFNNEVVNFQQIVDYITTDARFCYMVYNNRVLLTSDMQLTGGTRYVFFETSTTDSGLSKNTVVKVYSADGTTISSISHSTIANENFNNKVSTIAPNDKNSTVHYPNNKAVTEITDELKEDLKELDSRFDDVVKVERKITLKLGDEIITDNVDVSLGSGWTGSLENGFSHTSGTEKLVINVPNTDGKKYLLTLNSDNIAKENLYTVSFDGQYGIDPYNGTNNIRVGLIGNGNSLTVSPSSSAFSISNLSLREVTEDGNDYSFNALNISIGGLESNIIGWYNTIISPTALQKSYSCSRNVAIGAESLKELTGGARNVAVGTYAMQQMQNGERNIAIGADAMENVTSANDTIAIGKAAVESISGQEKNIGIGGNALKNHNGSNNTAIGYSAMSDSRGYGNNSVAVGSLAGYCLGQESVAVGARAGYFSKGSKNTCLGYGAYVGSAENTLTNSIAIGHKAVAEKSNQTVIGNSTTSETKVFGDLIVQGSDGIKRQIVFNSDGICSWEIIN